MGVSGVGKSTVGSRLADALGWPFLEGDAVHPPANIAKMSVGIALTDDDRWRWLADLGAAIDDATASGAGVIVTCSALKHSYRDLLRHDRPAVRFVELAADEAQLRARLRHRSGHFMPVQLLDSQLADWEPLHGDELADGCVRVNAGPGPAVVVQDIVKALDGLAPDHDGSR
ncbi:MAG: gluconokinase [Nostocoides sp.]